MFKIQIRASAKFSLDNGRGYVGRFRDMAGKERFATEEAAWQYVKAFDYDEYVSRFNVRVVRA